jgi:hypothetical protein
MPATRPRCHTDPLSRTVPHAIVAGVCPATKEQRGSWLKPSLVASKRELPTACESDRFCTGAAFVAEGHTGAKFNFEPTRDSEPKPNRVSLR